MTSANDVQRYLNNYGISYRVVDHDPAFSSYDAARASQVPQQEFAKTVIVRIDGKFWMTVLRTDHRINIHAIKAAFDARDVHLAHEEDLTTLFPDCELGAMPPFGNLYGIPVLLDQALLSDEEIAFNACNHSRVIRMRLSDYVRLVNPLIGRFSQPPFVRDQEL
ncbi:MAG: YbaK/EbsC family protein [Ignavibacteriales bacterium]|nr:YbaK/EbsC family protein [Ignavibacteriales bacterium]